MGGSGASSGMKNLPNEERKRQQRLEKTINKLVSEYKNHYKEVGFSMDDDGSNMKKYEGDRSSVYIYERRDRVTFHNHPTNDKLAGGTFSDADIKLATENNEFITYACDKKYLYSIRYKDWTKGGYQPNGSSFALDYKLAIMKYNKLSLAYAERTAKEMKEKGVFGKNDKIDYNKYEKTITNIHYATWLKECHNWLKNHSKEYGYIYRRHLIKGE